MAGLDASIYGSMKPIDTGDPMEYARNAMAMRTANLQQQQMQFNMMKAQNDYQYQQQQRAQAAAAYAKDQAAEKAANAFYGKTGAPASVTAAPSDMAGAASDVGMMGGAQGYIPGSVNTMANPAQPKNFDDAIAAALQRGDPASLLAARKLMAQKEAENTYKKSNLGVTQEEDKTAKGKSDVAKAGTDAQAAELDRAAKAMAYHANVLPSVTQENYGAWRANLLKDLPNLANLVPETPPADPAQFEQFKRAMMMKASDGIKTHYEKVTDGEKTYVVGIDAQGKATPVPGTEGTVKPTKDKKSDVGTLIDERNALDKNAPDYQDTLAIYNDRIAKANNIKESGGGAASPVGKLIYDLENLKKDDPEYPQKRKALINAIQEASGGKQSVMASADATIASTSQAINDLLEIKNHPAKADYTGMGTMDPRKYLPSSEGIDFQNRIQHSQGQAFLAAFGMLKGGGAISNIEGEKATAAINRMNTALSTKDFDKALDDAITILKGGMTRAQDMKIKGTWRNADLSETAPTAAGAAPAPAGAAPSPEDLIKLYARPK